MAEIAETIKAPDGVARLSYEVVSSLMEKYLQQGRDPLIKVEIYDMPLYMSPSEIVGGWVEWNIKTTKLYGALKKSLRPHRQAKVRMRKLCVYQLIVPVMELGDWEHAEDVVERLNNAIDVLRSAGLTPMVALGFDTLYVMADLTCEKIKELFGGGS